MNILRYTLLFIAFSAFAQPYPSKPVRIVAAYPAGTGVDIAARIVGHKLSEALGQQFIVDNRPGAGGNIAAEAVAKSPPDGYTLLFTNNSYTINPNLQRNVPYDALKDFAPVSLAGSSAQVMVAHPSLPASNVRELIALAKSRPGKVNIASAGSGSPSHLAIALFKHMAQIDVVHVPYKGAPAALTDLVAGQVDLYMSGLPPTIPMIKSGKVKPVAVTTKARSPVMPEVPSFEESGISGYELVLWYGLLVPAATPAAIAAQLNAAVVAALNGKDGKDRFAAQGVDPTSSSQAGFAALIRTEMERWARLVKDAGVQVE
jgi:tripartite-type tricarboxylate transporter receptor subunit TctC